MNKSTRLTLGLGDFWPVGPGVMQRVTAGKTERFSSEDPPWRAPVFMFLVLFSSLHAYYITTHLPFHVFSTWVSCSKIDQVSKGHISLSWAGGK
jgi:hypothetical protein